MAYLGFRDSHDLSYINKGSIQDGITNCAVIGILIAAEISLLINDILSALDSKKLVFLILLDLSAAFDTIDHEILLQRLLQRIGHRGTVYQWVESYLRGRTRFMSISGKKSPPQTLVYGAPQGSVLGPISFSIYTLPIGDIALSHNMSFHLYVDDMQLYMSFDTDSPCSPMAVQTTMQLCIAEIQSLMLQNKLKLNGDKA